MHVTGPGVPDRKENEMRHALRRAGSIAATLAVSVAVFGASASAEEGGNKVPFTTSGGCTEGYVVNDFDADNVRPFLPKGFELNEDKKGQTSVGVFAEDCVISVDGGESFATTLSGVVLSLTKPEGGFSPIWTSDAKEYAKAYAHLGWGSLVKGSSFEATLAPGLLHADADIPGEFSFSVDTTDAVSPAEIEDTESLHWGYGPFGAVQGDYCHDFDEAGAGEGVLQAAPGSVLEKMIGSAPVRMVGLSFGFTFSGITEIADPDAPPAHTCDEI
jgi:hypothetical protein